MSTFYTYEGKRIKCDPRCISATGKVCNCPCGGLFHQAAWTGGLVPEEWKDSPKKKLIDEMKELAKTLKDGKEGK